MSRRKDKKWVASQCFISIHFNWARTSSYKQLKLDLHYGIWFTHYFRHTLLLACCLEARTPSSFCCHASWKCRPLLEDWRDMTPKIRQTKCHMRAYLFATKNMFRKMNEFYHVAQIITSNSDPLIYLKNHCYHIWEPHQFSSVHLPEGQGLKQLSCLSNPVISFCLEVVSSAINATKCTF